MLRIIVLELLVLGVAASAYYWTFETEVQYGQAGLEYIRITPRGRQPAERQQSEASSRPPIRIATFNLGRLDDRKLANHRVSDILVHVIPAFDVVAVQGIRSKNQGVLVRLVEQINATGRQYKSAVCPTVKRDAVEQYSAFLFDATSIEIDPTTLHSVEDPSGRFRHKPLVALFRVKGPDEAEAFTFKLINVHTEPDRAAEELGLLDDVYKAVRDAEPKEDDVILLGDFGADRNYMDRFEESLEMTSAITDTPTTVRYTWPVDNILFQRRASSEFTGRSEVLDLMREFDLTLEGALEVSDHLPVWAEFSSYEGGQSSHMAKGTSRIVR